MGSEQNASMTYYCDTGMEITDCLSETAKGLSNISNGFQNPNRVTHPPSSPNEMTDKIQWHLVQRLSPESLFSRLVSCI